MNKIIEKLHEKKKFLEDFISKQQRNKNKQIELIGPPPVKSVDFQTKTGPTFEELLNKFDYSEVELEQAMYELKVTDFQIEKINSWMEISSKKAKIKFLRDVQKKTIKEIADITKYSERQIHYLLKKENRNENTK